MIQKKRYDFALQLLGILLTAVEPAVIYRTAYAHDRQYQQYCHQSSPSSRFHIRMR